MLEPYRRVRWLTALVVVLLVVQGTGSVAAGADAVGASSPAPVIVVDATGDADYRSIAAAAENATNGATIRVRPGAYHGGISLTENVTVIAPSGATIVPGPKATESAFRIRNGSHAAPDIRGFTVVGFEYGVDGWNTSGDWTLRNTSFRGQSDAAVRGTYTTGAWQVQNTTIQNVTKGLYVRRAIGDWVVANTTIRNTRTGVEAGKTTGNWVLRTVSVVDAQTGIEAVGSTGDWTGRNLTVASTAGVEADGALFIGVDAGHSTGNWRLTESRISTAISGVNAWRSSGNWTITDTRFENLSTSARYDLLKPPVTEGAAVFAVDSTGRWIVQRSTMVDLDGPAIDATDAEPVATVETISMTRVAGDRCVGTGCTNGTTSTGTTPTKSGPESGTSTTQTSTRSVTTAQTTTDRRTTPVPADATISHVFLAVLLALLATARRRR